MSTFLTRHLALILIIVLAFSVRLYKIQSPLLDWHSFRQADTASVTREYLKHGIDILHPRYHDLGNIQSGKENLEGYRMVEFPFINAGIAALISVIPALPIDITSRIVSVLFSLSALVCLFFVAKEVSGVKVAYATALVFSLLPYSVYYSRAVLPEPAVVCFFLLSVLSAVYFFKKKSWIWLIICAVSFSVALLLKPFVLFFAPVFVALGYQSQGKKVWKNWIFLTALVASVLPFLWWRGWISQFPSGIPANDWLFDSSAPYPDSWPNNPILKTLHKLFGYSEAGLRYHPAWFRWLAYERLTKLILGYAGMIFLGSAVFAIKKKELFVYAALWISTLVYFIIIARGNVQHDYYQVLITPIVALTVGRGIIILQSFISKKTSPLVGFGTVSILFLAMIFLSWREVKGYYSVNHPEYIEAGQTVDRVTPADAKIIAPAFGDTQFLYQTNRTGWPIGYHIEDKIENGATFYVSTAYDEEAKELEKKYATIEKTPTYILIDLTRTKSDTP